MTEAVRSATRPKAVSNNRAVVAVIVISDLEFGGAQRQVVELVNCLEAEGVTAHVCSLSAYVPLSKHLKREDRLRVIRRRFRYDFTVVFRLARFLREVRAEVVHAFLYDAEIASRLAGLIVRRPAIIGSERNTDYIPIAKDVFVERLTRSFQDAVIANSQSGADFNQKLIGFPKGKYRVVRNGVDVRKFRPRLGQSTRERLGIPQDAPTVGMFASFKTQKNHRLLLDAAKEIIEKIDGVRFLFVGDALHKGMSDSNEYKKGLLEHVERLGISDHCIFAGNRSDVEFLYPVCELTVLPSLFEGTPNVLLESMACGVPVIATDVSDNREIVPNGEVGFLIPSGDVGQLRDRILDLLQSKAMRERMSRLARVWVVEQFSSERLAERTAAVYRETIAVKSGSGIR